LIYHSLKLPPIDVLKRQLSTTQSYISKLKKSTHSIWTFIIFRLLYPIMEVSLSCPFLIAPSVFSNVYLLLLVWNPIFQQYLRFISWSSGFLVDECPDKTTGWGGVTKQKHKQYVLDTTIRKQTHIRHEPIYKQLEVKTNRTSLTTGWGGVTFYVKVYRYIKVYSGCGRVV
jgi:hypothetical protein